MSGIGSNPTAEEIAAKEAQERELKAAVGEFRKTHHPRNVAV
jgi:hypothetical protein